MKSLLSLLVMGALLVVPVRAENVIALFVKAPWPADGFVLHLVNTGTEDVPLSSVTIGVVPHDNNEPGIAAPTTREHIELGPGRVIPANGVTEGISLKRITNPALAAKIIVTIQSGDKSVKVEKILIERPDQR